MNIGDKVRFLSQTGGGIVVGFDRKGWALVEDSDGFEIPMPIKECVLIEENVVSKQDDTKKLSVKGGDKLCISLEYNKSEAILNNQSNYNLLVTYAVFYMDKCNLAFAGEVLPYEKKLIFNIDKSALQDGTKRVQIRVIPFKRGEGKDVYIKQGVTSLYTGVNEAKSWSDKPIIEKEFSLNMINLIQGKNINITIINENEEPKVNNLEQLKKELEFKYKNDINSISKKEVKKIEEDDEDSLIKLNSQGVLEVDLHIDSLLDSTKGMNNGDILLYQLDKFNEVMNLYKNKRGTKVVFIHGKGDGILRQAILKELKNRYPKSKSQDASFREYGFGATMIIV